MSYSRSPRAERSTTMGTRGIDDHPSGQLAAVPPWMLVFAAATSVQFGAAIATTVFDEVGAAGASLLRLGFAALILLAIWRPDVRTYSRTQLRAAGMLGLALGAMNFSFYEALDRLPLGVAVTIEFAGPLAVGVLASRRRADIAWALLAAAGIVLLSAAGGDGSGSVSGAGVALALTAGAFWALYIVFTQRTGQLFAGGHGLALACAVAAIVPLGPGLAEGGADLLGGEALALGLLVALMSSVIPYSLEMSALRRMPANVFGVLMSLEPALAALAGFLVLSQSLSARDLTAIACVVIASVGVVRGASTPGEPG
jgi:inner membrane transporter RhtA